MLAAKFFLFFLWLAAAENTERDSSEVILYFQEAKKQEKILTIPSYHRTGKDVSLSFRHIEQISRTVYSITNKIEVTNQKQPSLLKMFLDVPVAKDDPETQEINILKRLCHKNIVSMECFFRKACIGRRKYSGIVTEYLPQTLRSMLKQGDSCLKNKQVLKGILRGLVEGVAYMHKNGVVHRMILLENILVSPPPTPGLKGGTVVKICEFSGSVDLNTKDTGDGFFNKHAAPEIANRTEKENKAQDVWSVGLVMAALSLGENVFERETKEDHPADATLLCRLLEGESKKELLSEEEKRTGAAYRRLEESLDTDGMDLLGRMLRYDSGNRITPEAALKHPFFTGEGAAGCWFPFRRRKTKT
ncbi:MAG: CMGC/GSK protein kinase [Amphiamblys sp. WSBS2006]|nr:MAG: CMGC/GSK protein kinase [Amphiamblys sp. WSBS2006]